MFIFNILDTGLMMGLLLAGIVLSLGISFRLLNFPDLTIDGSFALSAAICTTMVKYGYPVALAMGTAILCAGLAGMITAVLHTKLRINKFLSGIIVVTAMYSVLIRVMNGGNISFGIKETFFKTAAKWNGEYFSLGTNMLLLVLVVVVFILTYLLLKSRKGIRLRAACLNTDLSKMVGLNTTLSLMAGLFFTNCLAGFTGSLFSLKTSFADIGYLQGMLIVSLASLTIGEKIIPSGKLNKPLYILLAALFGSIVYQTIWAIALRFNLEPSDLNMITAVIVIGLFFWNRNSKKIAGVEQQ